MSEKSPAVLRLEDLMRHALGMDSRRNVYQNQYTALTDSDEDRDWKALVRAGYAEKLKDYPRHTTYKVTLKGAQELNVTKKDFLDLSR